MKNSTKGFLILAMICALGVAAHAFIFASDQPAYSGEGGCVQLIDVKFCYRGIHHEG